MPVRLTEEADGKILVVCVTGKLTVEDYGLFVPVVERAISKHGKVRILFQMQDFHGWHTGALWEDVKFDLKHFNDIDRLAVVGETRWQKGMTAFCVPFTTAKIRWFESEELDQARTWLREP